MISTRAISSRLKLNVKPPRDPGDAALRRAARAAIIIPLAFAFTDLLLREVQILIFVVFGCFSLLVMAALRRNASVTWTGSAREGRGTFRVGSGALVAPFTYNSRFKGDMCRICNALAGTDVQAPVHPALN